MLPVKSCFRACWMSKEARHIWQSSLHKFWLRNLFPRSGIMSCSFCWLKSHVERSPTYCFEQCYFQAICPTLTEQMPAEIRSELAGTVCTQASPVCRLHIQYMAHAGIMQGMATTCCVCVKVDIKKAFDSVDKDVSSLSCGAVWGTQRTWHVGKG